MESLNGALSSVDVGGPASAAVVAIEDQFAMHYDAGFTSHHFA
jgi:hypothetical protein